MADANLFKPKFTYVSLLTFFIVVRKLQELFLQKFCFGIVMKKCAAILLVTLYSCLSSGMSFNVHYCMGQVCGVDFGNARHHTMKCCQKMATKRNCCKDKFLVLSYKSQHTFSYQTKISNETGYSTYPIVFLRTRFPNENQFQKIFNPHSTGPPINSPPIYISQSCFLI